MAFARPIIATKVGALPELITHENSGLLVPPADPGLLASAIDRLLNDRQASLEFAHAAHATARGKIRHLKVLPQLLSVYEDGSDYFHQVRAAGAQRTASNGAAPSTPRSPPPPRRSAVRNVVCFLFTPQKAIFLGKARRTIFFPCSPV